MPNQNLAAELRQMGTYGFGAMGSGTRGGSQMGTRGWGQWVLVLQVDVVRCQSTLRSRLSVSVDNFKGRIILEMAGRCDRGTERRRQVGP
jgi:hypothetical protein